MLLGALLSYPLINQKYGAIGNRNIILEVNRTDIYHWKVSQNYSWITKFEPYLNPFKMNCWEFIPGFRCYWPCKCNWNIPKKNGKIQVKIAYKWLYFSGLIQLWVVFDTSLLLTKPILETFWSLRNTSNKSFKSQKSLKFMLVSSKKFASMK